MNVKSQTDFGKALSWHTGIAIFLSAAFMIPLQCYSQDAMVLNDNGFVGIGLTDPVRQLHLRGSNAAFRMDRDVDSAAFLLTRTAAGDFNTILKTFVVGVRASAVNNGQFVIEDLGNAVGGVGARRMTIDNVGNVNFTGILTSASSARFKHDIKTLTAASDSLRQLRGVRFVRNDSGQTDLGLIAEEVAEVYPELVQRDPKSGQVESLNYIGLSAVLVEAIKEQQVRLDQQKAELATYREAMASLDKKIGELRANQSKFEAIQTRMNEIERLLNKMPIKVSSTLMP
jgi:hypothetical protein